MTSTNTFTGGYEKEKPSSRVLRPPGGGSSISFGGGDTAMSDAPKKDKVTNTSTGSPYATDTAMGSPHGKNSGTGTPNVATSSPACDNKAKCTADTTKSTSAGVQPVTNNAARKNCGYNPITGIPYDTAEQAGAKSTSVAVKQPPGGASTKLW